MNKLSSLFSDKVFDIRMDLIRRTDCETDVPAFSDYYGLEVDLRWLLPTMIGEKLNRQIKKEISK